MLNMNKSVFKTKKLTLETMTNRRRLDRFRNAYTECPNK